MLKFLCLSSLMAFVAVAHSQSKPKETQDDAAREIIAIERTALNRSDKGDVSAFLELSDPAVVYMDPYLDKPIYGLVALRSYYQRVFSPQDGSGEMRNATVQFAGEIAILTFQYDSIVKDKVTPWNATEIYRRTPSGWRIIHTHWSLRQSAVPAK